MYAIRSYYVLKLRYVWGEFMVILLSHVPGSPKALLLARPFLLFFQIDLFVTSKQNVHEQALKLGMVGMFRSKVMRMTSNCWLNP